MKKATVYHVIVTDDNGARRNRMRRLAQKTGLRRQYLAARVIDAGLTEIERIAEKTEAGQE